MWVHFNLILPFTLNPKELSVFISIRPSPCRLYYRPCYRLWWPVMVLSTLLESSKTWTPPQSWKTSKLRYTCSTFLPPMMWLFVSSATGEACSFIVTLLWISSHRPTLTLPERLFCGHYVVKARCNFSYGSIGVFFCTSSTGVLNAV